MKLHNIPNCSKEKNREKSIDSVHFAFGIGSPSMGQKIKRSNKASAPSDAACRTNSAAIISSVDAPYSAYREFSFQ